MVSRLEVEALGRAIAASQRDPKTMTQAELVQAAIDTEVVISRNRLWAGEMLAILHARGMSWPQIARGCEMPQSTVYNIYRSYMAHRDDWEQPGAAG